MEPNPESDEESEPESDPLSDVRGVGSSPSLGVPSETESESETTPPEERTGTTATRPDTTPTGVSRPTPEEDSETESESESETETESESDSDPLSDVRGVGSSPSLGVPSETESESEPEPESESESDSDPLSDVRGVGSSPSLGVPDEEDMGDEDVRSEDEIHDFETDRFRDDGEAETTTADRSEPTDRQREFADQLDGIDPLAIAIDDGDIDERETIRRQQALELDEQTSIAVTDSEIRLEDGDDGLRARLTDDAADRLAQERGVEVDGFGRVGSAGIAGAEIVDGQLRAELTDEAEETIQRERALDTFDEQTPIDLDPSDIELGEDGVRLDEDAQARVERARIAAETDLEPDEIADVQRETQTVPRDMFANPFAEIEDTEVEQIRPVLTDQARQERLTEQLTDDPTIREDDIVGIEETEDGEFAPELTEEAERRRAARALLDDETDIDLTDTEQFEFEDRDDGVLIETDEGRQVLDGAGLFFDEDDGQTVAGLEQPPDAFRDLSDAELERFEARLEEQADATDEDIGGIGVNATLAGSRTSALGPQPLGDGFDNLIDPLSAVEEQVARVPGVSEAADDVRAFGSGVESLGGALSDAASPVTDPVVSGSRDIRESIVEESIQPSFDALDASGRIDDVTRDGPTARFATGSTRLTESALSGLAVGVTDLTVGAPALAADATDATTDAIRFTGQTISDEGVTTGSAEITDETLSIARAGQTASVEAFRGDPAGTTGQAAGIGLAGIGVGVAAGRAAHIAGRAGRDRLRTAGSQTIDADDLAPQQVVDRVERGESGFPPAQDPELFQRVPSAAVREQARETTPAPIQQQFRDAGVEEGSTLMKALDVDPDGPGATGFRTQEGEFESPGAFVGPELSPHFLRVDAQDPDFSFRPGLPDLGHSPTAVAVRTNVRETDSDDLTGFRQEMLDREGETTARTLPPDEVNPGEIEAVVPPRAEFVDVGTGALRDPLRRAGIGSDFATEIGGRRVPIRTVAPRDQVDTGAPGPLDLLRDERGQAGARPSGSRVERSIQTRPGDPGTVRPLPTIPMGSGESLSAGSDGTEGADRSVVPSDIDRSLSQPASTATAGRRDIGLGIPTSPSAVGSAVDGGAVEPFAEPVGIREPVSSPNEVGTSSPTSTISTPTTTTKPPTTPTPTPSVPSGPPDTPGRRVPDLDLDPDSPDREILEPDTEADEMRRVRDLPDPTEDFLNGDEI